MPYNPASLDDRKALGSLILSTLTQKGFGEAFDSVAGETVLDFSVCRGGLPSGFFIRIYTSVVNGVARGDGEDAIRACLVWQDPKTNALTPISKTRRVNRTGEMSEIMERTLERGRSLYSEIPSISRCKCGAPKATSKAGNPYCAARCWIR
jgi:hypothetical protein